MVPVGFVVFAAALISVADGATSDNVDCELSEWTPQECDAETNTQVFTRTVIKEVEGSGRACDALTETRPCDRGDCQVSEWSSWSACQDDGYSVRTRQVLDDPQFGGGECPPLVDRVRCQRRLAGAVDFPAGLTTLTNKDSFHMTPVHVVQARVQSDKPRWNADLGAFGSTYYMDTAELFRGLLDTVNTASVEGALMYVQAEGINEAVRGATDRCKRKNNMKYVVFYDLVITQTNETLALYDAEYGTYLAMDGGQCTPTNGTGDSAVFPDECYLFNGDKTHANVGPFIGGEARDTDPRAPYPNTWWYSFPNSCPLQKWGTTKSATCRSATRTGLCDYDTMPDGIKCTVNYRVLGWVPIDDLVGITSMVSPKTGATYANFSEFCSEGNTEFNGTTDGAWIKGIDFWKDPLVVTANAARADKLVTMYNDAIAGTAKLTQVNSTDFANFKALPTIAALQKENPPCYKHIKACATATNGCKRSLYGQICTVCDTAAAECVVAPSGFTFPTLAKATAPTTAPTTTTPTPTTVAPTSTPSTSADTSTTAKPATSTTTKSAATVASAISITTMAATLTLSFML